MNTDNVIKIGKKVKDIDIDIKMLQPLEPLEKDIIEISKLNLEEIEKGIEMDEDGELTDGDMIFMSAVDDCFDLVNECNRTILNDQIAYCLQNNDILRGKLIIHKYDKFHAKYSWVKEEFGDEECKYKKLWIKQLKRVALATADTITSKIVFNIAMNSLGFKDIAAITACMPFYKF